MVYCYSGLNGLRHSLCKSEFVCDNLEGQDGGWVGGRLRKEGTHIYLQLIHVVEHVGRNQHPVKQLSSN